MRGAAAGGVGRGAVLGAGLTALCAEGGGGALGRGADDAVAVGVGAEGRDAGPLMVDGDCDGVATPALGVAGAGRTVK